MRPPAEHPRAHPRGLGGWARRHGYLLGAVLPDLAPMAGVKVVRSSLRRRWPTAWAATCAPTRCSTPIPSSSPARGRSGRELDARGVASGPARAVGHAGWELLLDGALVGNGDRGGVPAGDGGRGGCHCGDVGGRRQPMGRVRGPEPRRRRWASATPAGWRTGSSGCWRAPAPAPACRARCDVVAEVLAGLADQVREVAPTSSPTRSRRPRPLTGWRGDRRRRRYPRRTCPPVACASSPAARPVLVAWPGRRRRAGTWWRDADRPAASGRVEHGLGPDEAAAVLRRAPTTCAPRPPARAGSPGRGCRRGVRPGGGHRRPRPGRGTVPHHSARAAAGPTLLRCDLSKRPAPCAGPVTVHPSALCGRNRGVIA